ncbi:unnamed protein product [Ectocarpus sp. 13 AM-2016]
MVSSKRQSYFKDGHKQHTCVRTSIGRAGADGKCILFYSCMPGLHTIILSRKRCSSGMITTTRQGINLAQDLRRPGHSQRTPGSRLRPTSRSFDASLIRRQTKCSHPTRGTHGPHRNSKRPTGPRR